MSRIRRKRRYRRSLAFLGAIAGASLSVQSAVADGLSIEVAADGSFVVIDDQRSAVGDVAGKDFDLQREIFGRHAKFDEVGEIQDCTDMIVFAFEGNSNVGALCHVAHDGGASTVAFCDGWSESAHTDGSGMTRRDLVQFVATACTNPDIRVSADVDRVLIGDYEMVVFEAEGANFAERVGIFQSEFAGNKIPGTLKSCDMILELPVGVANGNRSYGGICGVDGGAAAKIAICDDEMVGHFKVKPLGAAGMTKAQLATFVAAYCTRG